MKILSLALVASCAVVQGRGSLRRLELDEGSENVTLPETNYTMNPIETAVPTAEGSEGGEIDVDETEAPETDPPTPSPTTAPPTTMSPTDMPTVAPTTMSPTDLPTLAPIPVPPNDLCVNAAGPLPITSQSLDGSIEIVSKGTTRGATMQNMDRCGATITSPSVWYTVTGNGAKVKASTCWNGTTLDTKLSIFSGTCSALTCIGGNDDASPTCATRAFASEVKWQSQIGTTYYVLVHGLSQEVGDFELNVFGSHDQCEYAVQVSAGDSLTSSIVGAAYPFGGVIQTCGDFGAMGQNPGVWYMIMGTGSAIKVTVCPDQSNGRPPRLHIFEDSCQDAGSCVGGDSPFSGCAIYEWDANAGTTYYILVHNFETPGNGIFHMTIESSGISVARKQIFD